MHVDLNSSLQTRRTNLNEEPVNEEEDTYSFGGVEGVSKRRAGGQRPENHVDKPHR